MEDDIDTRREIPLSALELELFRAVTDYARLTNTPVAQSVGQAYTALLETLPKLAQAAIHGSSGDYYRTTVEVAARALELARSAGEANQEKQDADRRRLDAMRFAPQMSWGRKTGPEPEPIHRGFTLESLRAAMAYNPQPAPPVAPMSRKQWEALPEDSILKKIQRDWAAAQRERDDGA